MQPVAEASQFGAPRQDSEPTAVPPRWQWLRRIAVASGVFILLLFALRLWWSWEANRRLNAEIKRCRSLGQPIEIEDFSEIFRVAEADNAALLLLQAGKALADPENGEPTIDELREAQFAPELMDEARALLDRNTETLSLVRRARSRTRAMWGHGIGSGVFGHFAAQRQISRLLRASATYYYHTGNHAAVLDHLHDGLHQADAIAEHPDLIHLLVAQACDGLILTIIEDFGATIAVTGPFDEPPATAAYVADRAHVVEIITRLLDHSALRQRSRLAFLGDVAGTIREVRSMPLDAKQLFLGPLSTLDLVRVVNGHSMLAQALSLDRYSEGNRLLYQMSPHASHYLKKVLYPMTWGSYSPDRDWSGRLRTLLAMNFRALTQRRLAATALAIRLYEIDHGRRPQRLADLAPDYLPTVPVDPFSASGELIRLAHGLHGDVLYSVGEDGDDDNGRPWRPGPQSKREGDIVFYLDGRPRTDLPGPPSTQAGEDDVDPDDDGGEPHH